MDPNMYLPYSPLQGLPQESKLATYMAHHTQSPATQQQAAAQSLNHAFGKLNLEPSPSAVKKVYVGDFVPLNYFAAPNIILDSPEHSPPPMQPIVPQIHQENVGGTTYFYSTSADAMSMAGAMNSSAAMGMQEQCIGGMGHSATMASPYQMYPGTPTHMGAMSIKSGLATTFYMPEVIRAEMYQRNEDYYLQPDYHQYSDIPENVEMYTDVTPLEMSVPHSMATSFRAAHRQTGEHFALRRLHSYSSIPSKRLDIWKQLDHPNIVRLHEYFVTKAFRDHSLVMVYDYHPVSMTILQKYLSGGNGHAVGEGSVAFHDPFSSDPDAPRPYTHQKNAMLRAVACGALLPESVIWSLLVQLTSALRTIHTAGLACRSLDPSKVIVNGCRVRISWCGVIDALHSNGGDIIQAQQDDLTALGRLTLSLACRTIHCDNFGSCLDLVARSYSADLKNLILYLLSTTSVRRSVNDLMPMIGARFYTQVEALERRADVLEEQLAREMDNGRLLRVLIKMSVVNERPELNMDPAWSETGNRYLVKLFRDYLFHSVTMDGHPWLDQAHLTWCLNQLDGGTDAKIELMSRDEQSVLVVSFAELKHCLEQAFAEVMQIAGPT